MMKGIWTVLVLVFLSAVACGDIWAQATAQISGTVRDQSGAVLPGVEVTATQTETGIARSVVTNETGSYALPNLAVGPYRFEAALPGFRSFVQTGIVLQVNSSPVINPVLQIGQVTEQVEVQANASLVETRSTAVGQVMDNQRILELPLNGRQVTDLITLSGAAVQTGVSTPTSWQEGRYISIAGGQSFGVMYSLDGAMHNNMWDGTQMPMPFPDALQEFKVEASGMGAAGGTRGSGGQVNAVTKAGTNELHGDAFEFVRNYAFNARNFFALQRDNLKRNQFGGTLGGPIVKNKVFFFGGYQGTKTSSNPGNTIAYIPTPAMMAGDWTTFASAACNGGRQIALRAPFANNRIDPATFSKPALNIVNRLPNSGMDSCGKITYNVPLKPSQYQIIGKVDYQKSADHSIFGRYMVTNYKLPRPYLLSGNLLALSNDQGGNNNSAQSYAVGSTYLISPNTINAFRAAVNRTSIKREGASFFSAPDIGIKAHSYVNDMITLSITGGFNLTNYSTPGTEVTNAYQIGDDVSLIRGNHQMTFGANLAYWRSYLRCNFSDDGVYSFTGQATGLGMADFLTGNLTSLNQLTPVQWTSREWYVAGYASDVWKARPKLTVSYGIRWEPFLPLAIGTGQGANINEGATYNFSEDRFNKGIKSSVFPNAPAGLYFRGDPGFPEGAPIVDKWLYFAPRIGLAWDVRGDGRTSIRASFGISHDFSGSMTLGGSSSAPPWGFGTTVTSPAGGFADPWRDFPGGDPFPYDRKAARFPAFSQYYFIQKYDMSEPRVQSWNLSVQRQIPADFLFTASYLGSQTFHLWVLGNINRGVYIPGGPCTIAGVPYNPCSTTANSNQRLRLFLANPTEGQYLGNMATREDSGTANYHGMLLSIQRRAARGLNIGGNYTWAHCIGDDPTANASGRGGAGYLDPNNRAFDRGNCSSDHRQIFNLTAVAATPRFSNAKLRMLGTGWQLSEIYRWATGQYLTLNTGLDRLLSGQSGDQRPNQILGNPYLDRNSLKYFNPSAFAQPDLGTMGNMRQYNIEGPGTWEWDMALSRIFQIRENQKLEFRAEAFNVTNSFIKGNPNTVLNSNIFGQINTTAADPRIMQFALKYSF